MHTSIIHSLGEEGQLLEADNKSQCSNIHYLTRRHGPNEKTQRVMVEGKAAGSI